MTGFLLKYLGDRSRRLNWGGLSRALFSLCCLGFPLSMAVPAVAGITQAGAGVDLRQSVAAPGTRPETGNSATPAAGGGQRIPAPGVQCKPDEIDFTGPFAAAIEQGVVEAGMAYRGTSFARLAALDPIKTDTDSDLQLAPWVSCMQQLAGLQGFLLAPVDAASHFPHGRVVDPSSYRRRNRH